MYGDQIKVLTARKCLPQVHFSLLSQCHQLAFGFSRLYHLVCVVQRRLLADSQLAFCWQVVGKDCVTTNQYARRARMRCIPLCFLDSIRLRFCFACLGLCFSCLVVPLIFIDLLPCRHELCAVFASQARSPKQALGCGTCSTLCALVRY